MFAILLTLAAGQPAADAPPRPVALTRLLDCRALTDQQQRLACYDAAVAGLAQAEATREVVVLDRTELPLPCAPHMRPGSI